MRLTAEGYELSRDDQLTMKIVLTHTEAFPFECYEGNLANGEYARAYLVKFRDTAFPELMFLRESDEFEDCATLESDSSIVEIDNADDIEAWEPVDACEIVAGEHYMPALTRPELLLLKTCLKRGGFNLPLEWRRMAKQLFARFDRDLQGEIQLGTDGQKTNYFPCAFQLRSDFFALEYSALVREVEKEILKFARFHDRLPLLLRLLFRFSRMTLL